jgi:hypothetical protein
MLEGGILMRIPDYRNVHGIKGLNQWTTKTNRVDKAHKDEFEKELEDSIHKRRSEAKAKKKEKIKRKNLAIIYEDQKLSEMQQETGQLFSECDKNLKSETDLDLDEGTKNNSSKFSSWS